MIRDALFRFLPGAALALSLTALSPAALACGGVVEPIGGSVSMNAQRTFYAVNNGNTDMVMQIYVPSSGSPYGMLMPLPAQPVIDPMPVDSADFDSLDTQTQPQIYPSTQASGGGGVGCGSSNNQGAGGAAPIPGVVIGSTVAVGAFTATSFQAMTSTALNTWLSANGFVIPAASQSIVDSYVGGAGSWFVAITSTAPTSSAASSIGIHVTLPGDQRTYAMRMASVGAGPTVAITAFVADSAGVGPAPPYTGLTLNDLNLATLTASGYPAAVTAAVSAHQNRAFVVEGVFPAMQVLSGRLATLAGATQQLTRLSTLMPSSALTTDVAFTAAAPATVPTTLYLGAGPAGDDGAPPSTRLWPLWSLALLLAGLRLFRTGKSLASRPAVQLGAANAG